MSFEIKKATRQGVKPLIGIFAESGKGKTMTSLLLARGLVGETGKIVMIDTESGRGSLYADVIPGGYEVIEMREPFSPGRYIDAISAAEASGAGVLVIDSGSHEWEGIGGVTEMAGSISEGRARKWNKEWDGSIQFGDWKTPKMEHQKFILKILQSPLPIIICLRAKRKSKQVKGTQQMCDDGLIDAKMIGKSCVIKDKFASPIQSEDFIFEMMAYMEIVENHSVVVIKHSHPSLRQCFPEDYKEPISILHGQKLAQWCNAAGKPLIATSTVPDLKSLKAALWNGTRAIHKGDRATLEQHLWDECHITPDDNLDSLTAEQIQKLLVKLNIK